MDDLFFCEAEREAELNRALEALHFAFRAVTGRPDGILAGMGLARVHHRILYFVGRAPGQSVNELVTTLGVSKQYLNRPLRQMVEDGFVAADADANDRRIKRLSLTEKGADLEFRLTSGQRRRLEAVFAEAGPEAEAAWRRVTGMLGDPRFDR